MIRIARRLITRRLAAPLARPLAPTMLAGFLAAAGLAGAFVADMPSRAQAQTLASFVLSDDDGYGVDACSGGGESCGHAVASAWCVANGYQRSVSLRRAEPADITGSIGGPTEVAATDQHGLVITCER